ncbi:MAG: alpha-L-fucosidase [Chloroflexia bacterium]|nr:alpha-L-fucosidase [Chloroflexia bacterium]
MDGGERGAREIPAWYDQRKLGIFVHWGPYSVPGWAPVTGSFDSVPERLGWEAWFRENPYAEWYQNTLKIAGSPTARHHAETYGEDIPYEDFGDAFAAATEDWDPATWVDLFRSAGAGYVVLTTKHHDGYCLWPSQHPNPNRVGWQSKRDLVGELGTAVGAAGMRYGLYYSGGLDWTFEPRAVRDFDAVRGTIPQGDDYIEYVDRQWRELIERYRPALLWNDIGMPAAYPVADLFAAYYRAVPDGIVNDRFGVGMTKAEPGHLAPFDITTPEYRSYAEITPEKWEATRGLGYSFGFNRDEGDDALISVPDLVHLLVDVVSKNGNLLLNVGPMADGTIPDGQRDRLEGLGAWLRTNGEAIHGTRPWRVAEGTTGEGIPIRFTQKAGALHVILLGQPGVRVTLPPGTVPDGSTVTLCGHQTPLTVTTGNDGEATVGLPGTLTEQPAYAFRIAPGPGHDGDRA